MKYLLLITSALLCFGNGHVCAAQSDSQSLVDLAKHSKSGKKEVIRLSDEDLPPARGEAGNPPTISDKTASGTMSAPATTGSPEPSSSRAGGEKTAASKPPINNVKRLQQQVASYREQESTWNQSATSYEEKLAKEPSEFRRNTYREAMENDRTNVSYLRQKIDETEAQLAKAEEAEAKRKQAGSSEATSDEKSQ